MIPRADYTLCFDSIMFLTLTFKNDVFINAYEYFYFKE